MPISFFLSDFLMLGFAVLAVVGARKQDRAQIIPRWQLLWPGVAALLAYLSMMAPRLIELHRVLKPTGSLVAKVFHGPAYNTVFHGFKDNFKVVKAIKPKASRDRSAETFLIGLGLKTVA